MIEMRIVAKFPTAIAEYTSAGWSSEDPALARTLNALTEEEAVLNLRSENLMARMQAAVAITNRTGGKFVPLDARS